jgi:16S rRNA (adenine1518-N6/adenine1519-N6)-dimethyltransferase
MTRARKRFGQHFLEAAWIEKLIRAVDPQADERFLEIGPGRGALTIPLAERAKSVIAYEIDRDLAADLQARRIKNVELVCADFLNTSPEKDPKALLRDPQCAFRVVGNLPYNVASPIMFRLRSLFREGARITDATLMLQREVADRLLAEPGTHDYSVLSVLMQHSATAQRLLNLPPGAFRPPPKVRSSVIQLRFHPPSPPVRDLAVFERLVKGIFTRRRKMLSNALLAVEELRPDQAESGLSSAGIDGRRRPETLTLAEMARLADAVTA